MYEEKRWGAVLAVSILNDAQTCDISNHVTRYRTHGMLNIWWGDDSPEGEGGDEGTVHMETMTLDLLHVIDVHLLKY